MRKFILVWILLSVLGTIIYTSILNLLFDPKYGFNYSFIDKSIYFIVILVFSLALCSPIICFNFSIRKLKLSNNKSTINLLFLIQVILVVVILYVFNLRGLNDYLYILLSYIFPGFVLLNSLINKRNLN